MARWDTMVEHKPNTTVGGLLSILTSAMPRQDSEYGALSQLSMPFLILDKDKPEVIKGPKGDKGDRGEPGPRGAQGLQGNPGTDGRTPVKGIDYFDGTDGAPGKDGHTPVKGVDYFDGIDGAPGPQGSQGPAGPQGEQGLQGPAGPEGPAGKRGPRGERGYAGKDMDATALLRYFEDSRTFWNVKEVMLGFAAIYKNDPTEGIKFTDRLLEAYRLSRGEETSQKLKSYLDCVADASRTYDPSDPKTAYERLTKGLGDLGLAGADDIAKHVISGFANDYGKDGANSSRSKTKGR